MNKMYILVRRDIPKTWYTPQACHAVATYLSEWDCDSDSIDRWNNGTMVILGVEDRDHLMNIFYKAEKVGLGPGIFHEPYRGVGFTSLAFIANDNEVDFIEDLSLL